MELFSQQCSPLSQHERSLNYHDDDDDGDDDGDDDDDAIGDLWRFVPDE